MSHQNRPRLYFALAALTVITDTNTFVLHMDDDSEPTWPIAQYFFKSFMRQFLSFSVLCTFYFPPSLPPSVSNRVRNKYRITVDHQLFALLKYRIVSFARNEQ